MPHVEDIEPLGLALLFAAIFVFGDWLRLSKRFSRHQLKLLSFSAGISVAYVFVHLLPELETARISFTRAAAAPGLPLQTYQVSVVAMIGFMSFYGVHNMTKSFRPSANRGAGEGRTRSLVPSVGAFALYVGLVSYLRINSIEPGEAPVLFFAVAMGTHFLTVDDSLRRRWGAAYVRWGRFALAASAMFGWALGTATELDRTLVILLFGFISGAMIANSLIEELPRENDGSFWPFLAGGVLYSVVLVPLT